MMKSILRRTKATTIIEGIALTLLGILFFANPGTASITITMLVGWMLLFAGVSTLCTCFFHLFAVFTLADIMIGCLEILPGLLMVWYPEFFVEYLFVILGIMALVMGIELVIESFDYRDDGFDGWKGMLATGIIAIICGILLFVAPGTAANVAIVLAGAALVVMGVSEIVMGARIPTNIEGLDD